MNKDALKIEHTITIDAAPERVWMFLTEPQYVAQWLGCMRYAKSVGHVFYMQQDESKRSADDIAGATHCEILELEEPYNFSFSWYLPGTPATEVHISLAPVGESTQVKLIHTGWDKFDAKVIKDIRDALAGGWKSFVLPNLKRIVNENEPESN